MTDLRATVEKCELRIDVRDLIDRLSPEAKTEVDDPNGAIGGAA